MNRVFGVVSLTKLLFASLVIGSFASYSADHWGSPTKLGGAPCRGALTEPTSAQTCHPRRSLADAFNGASTSSPISTDDLRRTISSSEMDDLVAWSYQNRMLTADDGTALAHVVRDFLDGASEVNAKLLCAKLIDRALVDGVGDAEKGVVSLIMQGFFSVKQLTNQFGYRAGDNDAGVLPYYVLYNAMANSITDKTGMDAADAHLLVMSALKEHKISDSFRGELAVSEVKALVQAIKQQLNDDEVWHCMCRDENNGRHCIQARPKKPLAEHNGNTPTFTKGFKVWQLLKIAKTDEKIGTEADATCAQVLDYTL